MPAIGNQDTLFTIHTTAAIAILEKQVLVDMCFLTPI
jgi:hypothetical protein